MTKILGIIPARLKSTRLPEKMLADIHGTPLIIYTIRQAQKSKLLDDIYVATDSEKIADIVNAYGVKAVLTSPEHNSGTDRIAELVKKNNTINPDIIVNIQGDEPIISPNVIDSAIEVLILEKEAVVSTIVSPISDLDMIKDTNVVKVAIDKKDYALYFSRSIIPFPRNEHNIFWQHHGIYCFKKDFLFEFIDLEPSRLEAAESLEQLRILEHGYKIKVAKKECDSISVDTCGDLEKVRQIIKDDPKYHING